MNIRKMAVLVVTAMMLAVGVTPAFAESLVVAVNKSLVLPFTGVERVAIANPEIADVAVVAGNEVIVVGKNPGVTSFHVWTAAGRSTYDIEVGANDTMIAGTIQTVLNQPNIKVSKVGRQ